MLSLLAGLLAIVLLVWGVVVLIKGAILFGIVLIVVGLLIGGSWGSRGSPFR